jgi:S1-C subfamily serine protease
VVLGAAPAGASPLSQPPPSTPLEQVQARVQPAVVYEQITWTGYVYDETNRGYFTTDPFIVSFQCTGFVVNPDGYIATAGHCVDYDATVREGILTQVVEWAYLNDYYEARPDMETIATFADNWRIDGLKTEGTPDLEVSVAYGVSVSGEPSGKALPARVVGLRGIDEGDVAMLKVEASDLTVLQLSDNANTGVGTEVVAVGYPASVDLVTDASFDPSFKEGSISAEKTTQSGLLPVYEISAAVSGGMSGGPTVGLDGDAIGVNSFRVEGETQPFNFVQPSQNLRELMGDQGVENTLGEVTDLYRAGLSAYFAGDRQAAIDAFTAVLQIVPSHEFAQDYLRKSQDLPTDGSLLSSPVLWGVALLVLLGAVIVIAILLIRRRSSGQATTPAAPAAPVSAPQPQVAEQGEPTPPAAPPQSAPADSPAPAEIPEAEARFCPNCGKEHGVDDHFCEHCGHPLT